MIFNKSLLVACAIAAKMAQAVEINAQSGRSSLWGSPGPDKPTQNSIDINILENKVDSLFI